MTLGVIALAFLGPNVAAAPPAVTYIQGFAFHPVSGSTSSQFTVASGVWVNLDNVVHQPHSDTAGCFDTGIINANGGVGTSAINCVGVVTYHCHIHPFMTGSITRQN